MSEESAPVHETLSEGEERALDRVLDRLEERLLDAPRGLHHWGRQPASESDLLQLQSLGLSETSLLLWQRFDGFELGHGEATVYTAQEVASATARLLEEGRAQEGDIVLGSYGRDDLVLCRDPWEEGADVVLVDEAGGRGPYASTAMHAVLGILAELSVILDDGGEYHDELFGEDGELELKVERRMLRRHLDADEDAPLPRFRLAQLLRRAGEAAGAKRELELCLRRAPNFAWAHQELGRAWLDLNELDKSRRAFDEAAQLADNASLQAYFLAWAALAAQGEHRTKRAAEVVERYPGFAAAQEAGAREAMEDEAFERAKELVRLGLAVAPKSVGLLDMRRALRKL
jgi:tetratricopeptide (TPR) repeat protein